MKRGDFRSIIDPKPPFNGKSGRENLKRENRAGLLEKEGKTRIFFLCVHSYKFFFNGIYIYH